MKVQIRGLTHPILEHHYHTPETRAATPFLWHKKMESWDQLECTDPARNDFWELAGSLPVNARSRGRLGLRLGLLYSRKATALAGAECGARGVEPGLIRPETR